MAASAESGIKFKIFGKKATTSKIKIPWTREVSFVCPPAWIPTLPRTTTEVKGRPPKSPDSIFPPPCANNSLFGGVCLLCLSNLSTASMFSNVSKEATVASTAAVR